MRGLHALEAIFRHMFDQFDAPHFIVRERAAEMPRVLLTWDFEFRFRRWQPQVTQCIHGASLLRFDDAGLGRCIVTTGMRRKKLYEKLPEIGSLAAPAEMTGALCSAPEIAL